MGVADTRAAVLLKKTTHFEILASTLGVGPLCLHVFLGRSYILMIFAFSGLTALRTEEVCEMMQKDYPDKYVVSVPNSLKLLLQCSKLVKGQPQMIEVNGQS